MGGGRSSAPHLPRMLASGVSQDLHQHPMGPVLSSQDDVFRNDRFGISVRDRLLLVRRALHQGGAEFNGRGVARIRISS